MTKRATILKPFKVIQMMVACMDVSHRFDMYFIGYLHTSSHEYNGMEYSVMEPGFIYTHTILVFGSLLHIK